MRPVDTLAVALRGADEIVAVTGATGWFGAIALDLLYEALGDEAPARVVGYAGSERELVVSDGRTVRVRPLADLVWQDPPPTTLLHLAFLTRDKVAALGLGAYVSRNIAISSTVLGAIAKHRPRHVVAMSSGAVHSWRGDRVGDLNADPYGALKYLEELALRAATRDVGGVCVIPRVYSAAGARMKRPGLYALGSMISMAMAGGPIEVRATGPVFRSYCGIEEVLAIALWAALSGREGVFDTCGTVLEMGQLARLVAEVHGLEPDDIERTWDPALPAERYVGDGQLMEELATEAGLCLSSLPALVRQTSVWLKGAKPVGAPH